VNQLGAVANSMPSKLAVGLPSTRIHPDLLVMHVILSRSPLVVSMVPSAFRSAGRGMLR